MCQMCVGITCTVSEHETQRTMVNCRAGFRSTSVSTVIKVN